MMLLFCVVLVVVRSIVSVVPDQCPAEDLQMVHKVNSLVGQIVSNVARYVLYSFTCHRLGALHMTISN